MKNPERRRKWLLITEFLALALLLVSVYALQHFHSASPTSTWFWLLVMALASLLLFVSFLGLTYLGWFSGEGQAPPGNLKRVLFILLTLVLLGLWVFAIWQTWQRMEMIRNEIRVRELMESAPPHHQAQPGSIRHQVLKGSQSGAGVPKRSLDNP